MEKSEKPAKLPQSRQSNKGPSSLSDCTRDELLRIQRALRKRFTGPERPFGIREIAFGTPKRRGSYDRRRGFCVCFYVKKKRMPRNPESRIPSDVSVSIARNGKRYRFDVKTDVVEFRMAKRTGVPVSIGIRKNVVNTGIVITWMNGGTRQWGVVTVGHCFRNSSIGSQVIVGGVPPFPDSKGSLLWKSKRAHLDVALVGVAGSDLVDSQLIQSENDFVNSIQPRDVETLSKDDDPPPSKGVSMSQPSSAGPEFTVEHFMPTLGPGIIQGVQRMDNMIRVKSSAMNQPFFSGTSGSAWFVKGQVGALQIAGTPDKWQIGYGQSVSTLLVEVELGLENGFGVRLVRAF